MRNSWWLLWLFVPGFGWAAFAYVGLRTRHRPWLYTSAAYLAPMLFWLAVDDGLPANSRLEGFAIGLVLLAGAAALAHGFAIRAEYRARLARREAEEQGRLAGIARGAPERVDLNHAGAEALALLPGVGVMGAEVAVRLRREGRFRSVEHFGEALGLPPALVERLRPLAMIQDLEGDQA